MIRTKLMLFAVALVSAIAPATASAAKTCLEVYYECLNDTWDTSGIERVIADAECGARYVGCLRKVIV
jgi:hypothetical protein